MNSSSSKYLKEKLWTIQLRALENGQLLTNDQLAEKELEIIKSREFHFLQLEDNVIGLLSSIKCSKRWEDRIASRKLLRSILEIERRNRNLPVEPGKWTDDSIDIVARGEIFLWYFLRKVEKEVFPNKK